MTAVQVKKALQTYTTAEDAVFLQRFFKTGVGQYGEGDKFIGVRVPLTRKVCKQFKDLPAGEVQKLLDSSIHEHRLAGVIILANKYSKASEQEKQAIYDLYLKNVYNGRINNWDIVDVTAPQVVGAHLLERPRDILFELAKSDSLWQKRVAMISTYKFLQNGDGSTTLQIAKILLNDTQDLIHKVVGWMLREMGQKVDEKLLINFLEKHARQMPRTMLRYSIEKLSPSQRTYFMELR